MLRSTGEQQNEQAMSRLMAIAIEPSEANLLYCLLDCIACRTATRDRFMNMNDQLRNLLVMASADGSLTEREIGFLTDRAKSWSIPEDEFAAAIRYALSDDAVFVVPETREDRVTMLQELIRMMAADGELADVEKELYATVAVKMGFLNDELKEIIDSVL